MNITAKRRALIRNGTLALPVLALVLGGCGGSNNVVARVGNMVITKAMFNQALANEEAEAKKGSEEGGSKSVALDPPNYTTCIAHMQATEPPPFKGTPGPTKAEFKASCEARYRNMQLQRKNAPQQVMGSLLEQERTLVEAREQGVHVSEAAVEAAAKKTTGFVYAGVTLAAKMRVAKMEMLQELLQKKAVAAAEAKITEAEVNAIFQKSKQNYYEPEYRDVLIILTKSKAAAERAKREIASGKNFQEVAKKVSIAGSAREGGELSLFASIAKQYEPKSLGSAILAAKRGVLTGPIKAPGGVWYSESGNMVLPKPTPAGYYIFRVTDITPAGIRRGARSEVKKNLAESQASQMESPTAREKKWAPLTTCSTGFVVKGCKEYKAPKPIAPKARPAIKSPRTKREPPISRKVPLAKNRRRIPSVRIPKDTIKISSPVVGKNHVIPARYTCAGADITLPLSWRGVPTDTKELVLLVQSPASEYPGSPWALAKLNPRLRGIGAGVLPKGAILIRNGFGNVAYAVGLERHRLVGVDGISYVTCPTEGAPQEYNFLLYALPRKLSVKPGFEVRQLESQLLGTATAEGSFFAGILHKRR